MDDLFKILIVDDKTLDSHAGEECGLYKEVVLSPSRRILSDYSLFFRGIIRSVWHDVSRNIEVICDSEDVYRGMFSDLKSSMESEENITFRLN
jgi:hypothetical protein